MKPKCSGGKDLGFLGNGIEEKKSREFKERKTNTQRWEREVKIKTEENKEDRQNETNVRIKQSILKKMVTTGNCVF